MQNVLVTGMSGTGKSTALAELAKRGARVIETDREPWSEWSDADGGYVWREELIEELLARDDGATLYVAGTVSNQGRFYPRFDAVVLLSAPLDVLLRRVEQRTTNGYGKSAEERAQIVKNVEQVEPLLRATCTHEIDATQPIDAVVSQLVAIGEVSLGDHGHVCADERRALLVNRALTAISVTVLEVRKGGRRRDRIDVILTVVVKRHVNERVVCEPEHEVADIVGLRLLQLGEHAFDPSLVLVCRLRRRHCVPGDESLLHWSAPFVARSTPRTTRRRLDR